ncbi:hypothetical protein [Escherichia coli]|uniref:hypothetical protein n=1 Tax=Escherichia coli TaxID=562 RepID=UPI0020CCA4CA|nr:hypothetical protein [Escherichia coli]
MSLNGQQGNQQRGQYFHQTMLLAGQVPADTGTDHQPAFSRVAQGQRAEIVTHMFFLIKQKGGLKG